MYNMSYKYTPNTIYNSIFTRCLLYCPPHIDPIYTIQL